MELSNIILNAILREVEIVPDRLESLGVWIGSNLIGYGEVRPDVHYFHQSGLSEQRRETDILQSLTIYQVHDKLQVLSVRNPIDLDAMK